MSKLAWRFFLFQKNSALAQGYRTRTGGAGKNRKTFSILERRPTMRKGVRQAGVTVRGVFRLNEIITGRCKVVGAFTRGEGGEDAKDGLV
jgi:hypothetical protein